MNAYPLAGFARSARPGKAHIDIGATRRIAHTAHTDWSLVRIQKHRRRHIAININCTRALLPYRAPNGKDQNLWHWLRCAVLEKFHWNCRMYFLWLELVRRVQQMMAGGTWCARDTNHYDAIKMCRANFVFFSDIAYRCRYFRNFPPPLRVEFIQWHDQHRIRPIHAFPSVKFSFFFFFSIQS